MRFIHASAFAACLIGLVFVGNGCLEKTLQPPVIINVASVVPYDLVPTSTATTDLPSTVISVNFETGVPTKLTSFSVDYKSKIGQSLPQLRIGETPMQLQFDSLTTLPAPQTITVAPYTAKVAELFEISASDLSPILATIHLTFEDVNNNTTRHDAVCRLFKFGG